jgi:hypothetical protein
MQQSRCQSQRLARSAILLLSVKLCANSVQLCVRLMTCLFTYFAAWTAKASRRGEPIAATPPNRPPTGASAGDSPQLGIDLANELREELLIDLAEFFGIETAGGWAPWWGLPRRFAPDKKIRRGLVPIAVLTEFFHSGRVGRRRPVANSQ